MLAHLLDLNVNTAIVWTNYAQTDWSAYLAARSEASRPCDGCVSWIRDAQTTANLTSEVVKTGLGYLDDLFGAQTTVGTEMAVAVLAGGLNERTIRALAPGYVAALLQALS